MSDAELHVPIDFCRNAGPADALRDEATSIDTGVWLIDHMCRHLGIPDLGAVDVLDFGCGVRFAQAIVNRGLPVRRYVGVDVHRELIDYLTANVADDRFTFVHLDAHNALYNPTGRPLAEASAAIELDGAFDLICLFSVFTHLAPHDYVGMLELLRRYVGPSGRLFFTLFVDEETAGGFGLTDRFRHALRTSTDPEVKRTLAAKAAAGAPPPAPFRDFDPNQPLMYALYSREHALELIEGTGWEVLGVFPPDVHLQHHVLCAPR